MRGGAAACIVVFVCLVTATMVITEAMFEGIGAALDYIASLSKKKRDE